MSSIRVITTFLTFAALFAIALFIGIAIGDPIANVALGFDLGGMDSQVNLIHETLVKYMVPIFLGTIVLWAVFFILREERQTIR